MLAGPSPEVLIGPVAAALAVLFAVIAAVSGPAWFDRDKVGFDTPTLEPSILGLLTVILVPVQLLLLAFAMRGFSQKWNVEVEVRPGATPSATVHAGEHPPTIRFDAPVHGLFRTITCPVTLHGVDIPVDSTDEATVKRWRERILLARQRRD